MLCEKTGYFCSLFSLSPCEEVGDLLVWVVSHLNLKARFILRIDKEINRVESDEEVGCLPSLSRIH